jgi:hypothetical protein
MKFYGVEVNVHLFLTSALDEDKQWASSWPLSVKQRLVAPQGWTGLSHYNGKIPSAV